MSMCVAMMVARDDKKPVEQPPYDEPKPACEKNHTGDGKVTNEPPLAFRVDVVTPSTGNTHQVRKLAGGETTTYTFASGEVATVQVNFRLLENVWWTVTRHTAVDSDKSDHIWSPCDWAARHVRLHLDGEKDGRKLEVHRLKRRKEVRFHEPVR